MLESTTTGPTGPDVYRTRGIYYVPGRVKCPLAGVGARPPDASNRLVVDDEATTVTIDRATGKIDVRNDKSYATKTPVADLLFLADGIAADGRRSPFSIHLKIFKKGHKYEVDLHRHLRNQIPMVRAEYEPFTVTARDGDRSTVLLDRERADKLCTKPSIALRIVKALMAMTDHTEGLQQDPAKPGYRVADLSVGFGALGLNHMMVRAELVSLDAGNARLIERGNVADMLREGAWEMRLSALAEKWLADVVKRDMFLFDLAEIPLLKGVAEHGLRKGQTLAFRISKGVGEVVLDGVAAPLPNTYDVVRSYIEFHMLGGLLAESAERGRKTN
jgi:hypothetical protein